MRHLIIILFFLLPSVIFAQSKADYQSVMTRFVKFYNKKQGDSIVNLFASQYRSDIKWMWTPQEVAKLHKQYGTIKSFKYLRTEKSEYTSAVFETIFSLLETNGSAMTLNRENYLESFALVTSEPKLKKKPKGK